MDPLASASPRLTPSPDPREHTGRVALVTGGASGIGRAIAVELAAAGAAVAIADRDEPAARRAAGEIAGSWPLRADVSVAADCTGAVEAVLSRHGRIDILVNNAGYQHMAPLESFPLEVWEAMLATMLTGPFLLTRAVLPAMYRQGWGRIVNMASIHALVASPSKGAYIAAKHGLLGLTRATAIEAGAHGVTANAVCPAFTRTPLVEKQVGDQARLTGLPEDEVVEKIMLASAAVKRLLEPSEIAAYVRFLCSEAAGGITGTAQVIDGGWTAR